MKQFKPINEGLDHVNIYSKSGLWLGRELSNFSKCELDLGDHGKFNSIEGYWFWLGTRDERLRTLYGYQAKKLGTELSKVKQKLLTEKEFRNLICLAIEQKIYKNQKLLDELLKLDLNKTPLTHYYYYGNINNPKVINAGFLWIVDFISSIHLRLKCIKQK